MNWVSVYTFLAVTSGIVLVYNCFSDPGTPGRIERIQVSLALSIIFGSLAVGLS